MDRRYVTALRATTALQVAIYELVDESVNILAKDSLALIATETCLAELTKAIKEIKKRIP
jgi:hypothetical protein